MYSSRKWTGIRLILIILFFELCFQIAYADVSDSAVQVNKSETPYFDIRTGVNISHWLSQSEKRGEERRTLITRKDFQKIAELGFDHIRLPMDEVQLTNEDGSRQDETFTLMHKAINWSLEFNLKVIVDLHIIRSHHFNDDNNDIWTNPEALQELLDLWGLLSSELTQYPTDKLAYEVLNEAVADDHEDWNRVSGMLIADIRKREPSRFIVLGSNRWQGPETFPMLAIPENDPYIILSFHFYSPHALTHYKAWWMDIEEYQGPVSYPGITVPLSEYSKLSEKAKKAMSWASGDYDKEKLESKIMPAIRVAQEAGLQLYCGEYGVYPLAPEADSLRWYADLISVFIKHDIAHTHWAYKGDFPVLDANGRARQPLVSMLLRSRLESYTHKSNLPANTPPSDPRSVMR